MKCNSKYTDSNTDEINLKALGEIIRQRRVEMNIMQQVLAVSVGRARTYIIDIEAGRYMPSVITLLRISKALEIDTNVFKDFVEIVEVEEVEKHKHAYLKKKTD